MRFATVALMVCVTACGCGDGNGGMDGGISATDARRAPDAGCAAFTPCGGSLAGTWQIASVCTQAGTGTPPTCPQHTAVGTPTYAGTFYFSSLGSSYSITTSTTSSENDTYSPTCLSQLGATCSALNASSFQPDAGVSGSCTSSSAGDCNCSVTYQLTNFEQGTYASSGNTFTTTPETSASPTTAQYCVQGNTLRIHVGDSAQGDGFTMTIALTKQ